MTFRLDLSGSQHRHQRAKPINQNIRDRYVLRRARLREKADGCLQIVMMKISKVPPFKRDRPNTPTVRTQAISTCSECEPVTVDVFFGTLDILRPFDLRK